MQIKKHMLWLLITKHFHSVTAPPRPVFSFFAQLTWWVALFFRLSDVAAVALSALTSALPSALTSASCSAWRWHWCWLLAVGSLDVFAVSGGGWCEWLPFGCVMDFCSTASRNPATPTARRTTTPQMAQKAKSPKMINDFSSDLQQNQVTSHITSLSQDQKVVDALRKIVIWIEKFLCGCNLKSMLWNFWKLTKWCLSFRIITRPKLFNVY